MANFLTSPLSAIGSIGESLLSGIGDLGGFLGDFASSVSPLAELGIGVAQSVGALTPAYPVVSTAQSSAPRTSPMLPAVINRQEGLINVGPDIHPTLPPLLDPNSPRVQDLGGVTSATGLSSLFQQVGNPATPPGGTMPLTISPRASQTVRFPHQVQGCYTDANGNQKVVTYRNMGQCILFSGDRAAAKRYAKHAGYTLRRRRGGR